jgi:Zn-dependent peptidase ImmA (M78 family)/transcriptional regulator with XRE-family HTH domain
MTREELALRLKTAREATGLSLSDAAKRLGFPSYQTLSNIENCQREVKVSELARFARTYFCNLSDFLMGQAPKTEYAILWRNPPQSDELKKQAEREIFSLCEQYHILEHLLGIKAEKGFMEVTLNSISSNPAISRLAKETRILMGLGQRPSCSLQKVLEQDYGVKIIYTPLFCGSAASMVHADMGKAVVINANEAPWRQNFDLAHELFHLISWNKFSMEEMKDTGFFAEIEKKADRFAAMLLLPEDEVRREIEQLMENNNKITYSDVVDIAIAFGVSAKALVYRLANIKIISWEIANALAKDEDLEAISKQKRNQDEKVSRSDRFIALAVRCLRKGFISRGKFTELIGIDRSDIDDFVANKGMMESEGKTVEVMAS